jgi:hypothetical protein
MRRSVEIFNESATGCANAVQTAETAGKDLKNAAKSNAPRRKPSGPRRNDTPPRGSSVPHVPLVKA